jgi:ribosomal protein S18 acetylase RimI-like enzyme
MAGRPERAAPAAGELRVRELRRADLASVTRLDALHTGAAKPAYWRRVFAGFLAPPLSGRSAGPVGLAALDGERLAGYLLGEVRAFEFGSEACGWVFSVGVDPRHARRGVASRLLAEACRRFHGAGLTRVRTMVRRSEVPVLAFFRANGFRGGPFVQLELDLKQVRA